MMLMPSIFHDDVFDDFFDFSAPAYSGSELMNTDIKETEKGYELAISLPGVKKEDIKAEVKDGYLMITAAANSKTCLLYTSGGITIKKQDFPGG